MSLQELIEQKVILLRVQKGVAYIRRVADSGLDKPKGYMSRMLSYKAAAPTIPDGTYLIKDFEEDYHELKLRKDYDQQSQTTI